jgi:uncharacterized protein (TIGR01777 family)
MKVLITGANGFVGTHLATFLLREGHQVTGLVRSEAKGRALPAGASVLVGDSMKPGSWQEGVAGHDVLINLAGANIFKRWNRAYKKLLRDSRILTTRNLVDAIESDGRGTLLSTSAVGYYGFSQDEKLDETAPPGADFLAELARDWETEAFRAREKGVRVIVHRFGIVLGRAGGALPMMALPFRLFAGGTMGSGSQWLSWIHIEDLCRAVLFVASNKEMEGPVNFTAPEPVTNRELAATIAEVLHRPSWMWTPGFVMELVLGEFGSVMLKGQRVVPRVLELNGFYFKYPDIKSALLDLL